MDSNSSVDPIRATYTFTVRLHKLSLCRASNATEPLSLEMLPKNSFQQRLKFHIHISSDEL